MNPTELRKAKNKEMRRLHEAHRRASMTPEQRQVHLEKKRAYAKKKWEENREALKQRNKISREKSLLLDPVGFRERHLASCKKWIANNRDKRAESIRKYQSANRSACCKRSAISHRKRIASDPVYRLEMKSRLSQYTKLKQAVSGVGFIDKNSRMAVEWFTWLKLRGVVDWTKDGIELDHVLPMAFFDKTEDGWVQRASHWTNLFPLEKIENIRKRDKIVPDYIAKVAGLIELFVASR